MIIRSPEEGDASPGTISIAVQAGRYIYPPKGMFGGKDASLAKFQKNGENADPSTLTFCDPGDTISFISAGGGGYGDPLSGTRKPLKKTCNMNMSVLNAQDRSTELSSTRRPFSSTMRKPVNFVKKDKDDTDGKNLYAAL